MSNCESHRKPGDGKTWENEGGKLKAVVLIAEPTAQIGKTLPSATNNCLQDQTAREKNKKKIWGHSKHLQDMCGHGLK